MELKDRIRQSLAKRSGYVVLRRELARFGSRTQLSQALLALQREGLLQRIGEGIYAKPATGEMSPEDWALRIAREAYARLGVTITGGTLRNHEITVHAIKPPRRDRSLRIAGRSVRIERHRPGGKAPQLPDDIRALPTTNVEQFVQRLAAAHRVAFRRTRLDDWTEAVTAAAGDNVRLDETDGLLIRLKQRNVLNAAQFTRLLINHRRELARV